MNNSNSTTSSGIGVFGVVGIVFVVLKLLHVIEWSWLWVLCPFWIGLALLIVSLIIIALVSVILTHNK